MPPMGRWHDSKNEKYASTRRQFEASKWQFRRTAIFARRLKFGDAGQLVESDRGTRALAHPTEGDAIAKERDGGTIADFRRKRSAVSRPAPYNDSMRWKRALASSAALACIQPLAFGTWTVEILHPLGATESEALGVRNGQQVGWARIDGVDRAFLWEGSSTSALDLHPPGWTRSIAYGVADGQQVGSAYVGGTPYAASWSGTMNSFVQASRSSAAAYAVDSGRLVGWYGGYGAALLAEIGSAWSFLSPGIPGHARALHKGTIGGNFGSLPRARIWRQGAPGVTLHKPGHLESHVFGVYGTEQVGRTVAFEPDRAVFWRGSAESMLYLGPDFSRAHGVFAGQQVGEAKWQTYMHATRWVGQNWPHTDLHQFLPTGYLTSEATAVWDDSEAYSYVAGFASEEQTGDHHAVLWKAQNISVSQIESLQVERGLQLSGGLTSVQASDEKRLVVRPGPVLTSLQPAVQLAFEADAAILSPACLSLSIESSSSAKLKQVVEFFDFLENRYVVMTSDIVGQVDKVARADVSYQVSRYVQAQTGRIRARVGYFADGPALVFPWEIRVDRVWWHMLEP